MSLLKKKILIGLTVVLLALNWSSCDRAANESVVKESEYPLLSESIMKSPLNSTAGSAFTLESYRGKVILVNFWATWCGPCRAEMPDLDNFQRKFAASNFDVIGINSDDAEDLATVSGFEKEIGVSYQLVKADRQLFGEFYKISRFDAIPQSFLIDREGRLRGVFVGGGKRAIEKMQQAIEKALAK